MISKMKILVPTIREQQKIAAILSTWDEVIEVLEKLIILKSKKFKWLLKILIEDQQKNNNCGWKKIKLEDVGTISSAGVDKKIISGESFVLLVNYLDVLKKDFIHFNDLNHQVTAPENKMFKCNVKKGDVFFTPSSEIRGDIAHSAVSMEDMDRVVYSYHVVRFRLNENWNIIFRAYIFKCSHFYKQAYELCEGSGQRYVLSQRYFRNMTISVPNLSEQNKIANVLFTASREMSYLKKMVTITNKQKKGLMQQLLTGKKRVKI